MSENDKKTDPEKSPSEDDELESLNDDEKAAFEKIMAEIAAATGDKSAGSKTQKPSGTEPAEADGSSAPLDAETTAVPPDTNTPDGNVAQRQEPIEVEQSDTANTAEDDINEDQEAALNQIMAEIESKRSGENDPEPSASPAQGDDEEALDENQQAALNQIMAEIESKRKGDKDTDTEPSFQDENKEELNEDQQAALDQIMTEIESKRIEETDAQPTASAQGDDEEALDENQQAALSQIMAEIESKRKGEKAATSEPMDDEKDTPDTETADEEQQAALEKIMAEIEAQKGGDSDERSENAEETENGIVAERNDAPDMDNDPLPKELSMDEFEAELNNLISSTSDQATSDSTDENITTPVADDTTKDTDKSIANNIEKEQPQSTSEDSDNSKDAPDAPNKRLNDNTDPFPILQEISDERPSQKTKSKIKVKKIKIGNSSSFAKKSLKVSLIALVFTPILIIAAGICYWAYQHFLMISDHTAQPSSQTVDVAMNTAPTQTPRETVPVVDETPPPVVQSVVSRTPSAIFSNLKKELSAARLQIKNKISDIRQLKSYYDRGVAEEYEKIEERLLDGQIPSFQKAMADEKIELGLRAIQRRQVYMVKLETPLTQLTAISEELLYLERKTHIYEILQTGINGLPVENFKDEVLKAIESYLQYQTELSIDRFEVSASSLKEIWNQVAAHLNTKANLLAQRAPLNRSISAEICRGNYDRKYLLTAISEKTAGCLIKWGGKDLYLNTVTELPPGVAKILAQWKGEWLSLNGVTELSAQSAQYLSQWRGKRLSLNGLTHLPQEVTQYLSKWEGEQLEMIGLRSIGSWENYGTKLFLSEKLKQTIEEQVQQ